MAEPAVDPAPGCALCAAEQLTPWFHTDDRCWVAECLICRTPMVVWRRHGPDPRATDRDHMLARLAEVAAARLGRAGVREIVELPLSEAELANLRDAAEAVRSKQADVAKLSL